MVCLKSGSMRRSCIFKCEQVVELAFSRVIESVEGAILEGTSRLWRFIAPRNEFGQERDAQRK